MYRVYLSHNRQLPPIAWVSKSQQGGWLAINKTDMNGGVGKTRDAAVDNLLEQIGGLG